jgi:hypothetical protein
VINTEEGPSAAGLMEEAKVRTLEVVRKQLQSYIGRPTVQKEIAEKNFRAFAVVIIGSRQILAREMERIGNWVNDFKLAKNEYHVTN